MRPVTATWSSARSSCAMPAASVRGRHFRWSFGIAPGFGSKRRRPATERACATPFATVGARLRVMSLRTSRKRSCGSIRSRRALPWCSTLRSAQRPAAARFRSPDVRCWSCLRSSIAPRRPCTPRWMRRSVSSPVHRSRFAWMSTSRTRWTRSRSAFRPCPAAITSPGRRCWTVAGCSTAPGTCRPASVHRSTGTGCRYAAYPAERASSSRGRSSPTRLIAATGSSFQRLSARTATTARSCPSPSRSANGTRSRRDRPGRVIMSKRARFLRSL